MGAFAAFGMGALGKLLGNVSDAVGSGAWATRKKREAENQFNRAHARDNLMAQMEAFKAAGIHPLVGLGQGGAFSGGMGGGVIGGGSEPIPQYNYREPEEIDPDIARYNKARADLAEVDVQLANKRLAEQPGNPPAVPALVDEDDQFTQGLRGKVTIEGRRIPSASMETKAAVAGETPMWEKVRTTDGRTVWLPYAGEGQTFWGQSPLAGALLTGGQLGWQYGQELKNEILNQLFKYGDRGVDRAKKLWDSLSFPSGNPQFDEAQALRDMKESIGKGSRARQRYLQRR